MLFVLLRCLFVYSQDGDAPLALAAYFGHMGVVVLLREAGADMHRVNLVSAETYSQPSPCAVI